MTTHCTNLTLDSVLDLAAEHLPDDYEIRISVEYGSGLVQLWHYTEDEELPVADGPVDSDESLAEAALRLLEFACQKCFCGDRASCPNGFPTAFEKHLENASKTVEQWPSGRSDV